MDEKDRSLGDEDGDGGKGEAEVLDANGDNENLMKVPSCSGPVECVVYSRKKRMGGGGRGRKRGRGSGRVAVPIGEEAAGIGTRRFTRLDAAKLRKKEKIERIACSGEEEASLDGVGEECLSSEDDSNFTMSRIKLECVKRRRESKELGMRTCSPVVKVGEEVALCSVQGVANGDTLMESADGSNTMRIAKNRRVRFSIDVNSYEEEFGSALDNKADECRGKGHRLRATPTEKRNAEGRIKARSTEETPIEESLKTRGTRPGKDASGVRKRKIECEVVGDVHQKIEAVAVKGSNSVITPTHSTKRSSGKPNRQRSMEIEKVRDRIKGMLLSSGWTIDLRPRKGKSYMDSVYISPQGSGYWSITKAYNVFQLQLGNDTKTDKVVVDESGDPLKSNGGSCQKEQDGKSTSFVVPDHLLGILKRKVVNKRRSKSEIEEGRRAGGSAIVRSEKKTNGLAAPRSRKLLPASKGQLSQGRKKKNKRESGLLARKSIQGTMDSNDADDYIPYTGKRSVLAWIIDSGIVSSDAKVRYVNQRRSRALLEGLLKWDGIHCNCCNKLFTVSDFEKHAGSRVRQPYHNIFVGDTDLSLAKCQLQAWQNQEESEKCGFYPVDVNDDPNDDTCGICGDGGELVCCDGCPSTFHLNCLDIPMLPSHEWHCLNCSCKFCGLADGNAVDEIDSCPEMAFCFQCEKKFHQDCVPEDDTFSDDSSTCISFCGNSCKKIFEQLQKLLGARNELEEGFSWSVIRRLDDYSLEFIQEHPEKLVCNSKIAVALAIMDECFLPIVDQRSGLNLVHNVVYNCGSNFDRINFSSFYMFILERGDEMIATASIRVRGTQLAEMPFIGTRVMYRRQGMCSRLLTVIESVLSSFHIEKLVIPAISELQNTWTGVFGFEALNDKFRKDIKSMNLLVFPGTGLLVKPLLKVENFITIGVPRPVEPEHGEDNVPLTRAFNSINGDDAIEEESILRSFSDHDPQMVSGDSLCSENIKENEVIPPPFLPNDEINLTHTADIIRFNISEASNVSDFCLSKSSLSATEKVATATSDLGNNGVTMGNEVLCMLNFDGIAKVDAYHNSLHMNEMAIESHTLDGRDCTSHDLSLKLYDAIDVPEVDMSRQQLHSTTGGGELSLQSE